MSSEVYIVHSKVRGLAKKKGFRFSGEALDRLSLVVAETVLKAGARAKDNKRHTIKACDI
jgi:histone H3/H4